jgi:hypothetical protein
MRRLVLACLSGSLGLLACQRTEDVGALPACGQACEDGGWPIGDAAYSDFDPEAFDRVAAELAGTWHGVATGFENIWPPFEMHFEEGGQPGAGSYVVICSARDRKPCVPFYPEGDYELVYVDSANLGQGQLSWRDALPSRTSVPFRNLELKGAEDSLFFQVKVPYGFRPTDDEIVQVGLARGPRPDGLLPEASAVGGQVGAP